MNLIVEFYRKRKITIAFLPPHMARKFMKEDISDIPLRVLLVGSEPVRHLEKKPYRILNVYAASECSSLISVYEITGDEAIYPIGTLNPTLRGYIVDEDGQKVEPGQEGELWLAGPQVSRGYLQRPEATMRQYRKILSAVSRNFRDCLRPMILSVRTQMEICIMWDEKTICTRSGDSGWRAERWNPQY